MSAQLQIGQMIGVGYTYKPSLAMRRHMTKDLVAHHSSQTKDFTYFYKGEAAADLMRRSFVRLRMDPETHQLADHWPEPELAMLLGDRHSILGYTLAIDFTAHSIELRGRTTTLDGTYFGKVWDGACVAGPRFIDADSFDALGDIDIAIAIERAGETIYDNSYSTAQRKRDFSDIPHMILDYRKEFAVDPPKSKKIAITAEGYLAYGTLVMLGTGLILPHRCYSQDQDVIHIRAPMLGLELKTKVLPPEELLQSK